MADSKDALSSVLAYEVPFFSLQSLIKTDFKNNIVCIEDLQVGKVLSGRMENAAMYGVYVDIGMGRAGLFHF